MRRIGAAVLALACWLAGAQGQEREQGEQPEQEPGPELDFLEYLGAWAEEDDEWLAIEEWQKDIGAEEEEKEDAEESESEREDDDESE